MKDERRCSKFFGAEDSSIADKQFGGSDGLTKLAVYLVISVFIKSRNKVYRPPKGVKSKVNDQRIHGFVQNDKGLDR